MNKNSIGIIGVGVVGQAVADYYKAQGHALFYYDKYKKLGCLAEVAKADIIFVCLPTPTKEDGSQDISAFNEIVPGLPAGKIVVLKSTVLPGTTEYFQKQRLDVKLLHNSEFLDAKTAARDFAEPDLQIVGYTGTSKADAEVVMNILPRAPHSIICKSGESEMVKYFLNTFMATKNIFANQMYDYCAKKGIDYENVKDIVKLAPRIGGEVHLKVFADGYRGFAGMCLPKDLAALIGDAASNGSPLELLGLVKSLNEEYIKRNPK